MKSDTDKRVITVFMKFASKDLDFSDREVFDIFSEAVENAELNLRMRFGVRLSKPEKINDKIVKIDVTIPNEMDQFSVGPRLSGIGRYLIKKYPDKFKEALYGTRLLYAWEV